MNGAHDVGGMMSFGPVAPEADEPVFHHDWERRAFGIVLTAGAMGQWPGSRFTREGLPPAVYYGSTYYEIWIRAAETLLRQYGFVTDADLAAGRPVDPAPVPNRQSPPATDWPAILARGAAYSRPVDVPPRFAPGDRVRAKNINPTGHTRLPRYVRGKHGIVESEHGGFVFPDANARGEGENPQRLYTVVFAATELWGEGADPTLSVSIDAFEPYLEPAA
jgi:nitrile hydratase beta subunit